MYYSTKIIILVSEVQKRGSAEVRRINMYKGDIIGREIIFFESVSSTNDTAINIGRKSVNPDGIVVIADEQSHGRGRFGKSWVSPPGVNLYFTVLLRPPILSRNASLLTLVSAVAVTTAIRDYTGLNAEIKWPNDILINGKKTAGILIDMKSDRNSFYFLAVGIGVNVNMSPEIMPEDIRPHITSLKAEIGKSLDKITLLSQILAELENQYKILLNGNKMALINEWLRLNSTIGRKVKVQSQDRIISGTAKGIDETGQLILRLDSGKLDTVSAGEVTILKDDITL
jgi:BirA family biotin operon repressor/biotin-[acetyl-CoA-carboxylase] ligase